MLSVSDEFGLELLLDVNFILRYVGKRLILLSIQNQKAIFIPLENMLVEES